MGRLDGRVCIVTGAGQGIGRGVARKLASEGARVVVAEIDDRTGAAAAEEVGGRFVQTDVGDRASVDAMVATTLEELGRVDVLVNNAQGLTGMARVEHVRDDDVEFSLRTGYYGTLWAMRACYPHMRDQGGGRIVNFVSLNGINAHPYTLAYNTAKEAIRALTRTAAREWGRHDILVNCVAPAARTPAYDAFVAAAPDNAAALLRQNPLGRMGDPTDDIGGVVLFLASDDSRYVTGITLFADGGGHINGVNWDPGLPE